MRIADAQRELESQSKANGLNVATLRPSEAVPLMGTYNWGKGEHFELNITRQLIRSGGDSDSDIFQLGLTLRFPPSDALRAI
jgi:hypothetical protein